LEWALPYRACLKTRKECGSVGRLGALPTAAPTVRLPLRSRGSKKTRFALPLRNIHKLFQPFLPQNPHGYCVHAFKIAAKRRRPVNSRGI
ncbi:MAG: hypothetical protein ACRCV9_20930, partial [Burkholderiaceae bacterium]